MRATDTARGRLGAVVRHHPGRPDLHDDARRDLAAARIADYIARVTADAPPLTSEQRDRLAALLRPGAAA